ncbi:MAG: hypothetical protein WCI71_02260, partial [Bacteroidota bacterium]
MSDNPFYKYSGSDILKNPVVAGLLIFISIIIAFALSKGGFLVAIILFAIPVTFFCFYWLFLSPELGLSFAFILNFFILGVSRYIPVKLGYLMDIT